MYNTYSMSNYSLMAVAPIDGRYRKQVEDLSLYFSEYALIKYRVRVEIEYFIALCEVPLSALSGIDKTIFVQLQRIYQEFSVEDAQKIKEIEKVTNHDVKAVEYFIKEKFDAFLKAYENYKDNTEISIESKESIPS